MRTEERYACCDHCSSDCPLADGHGMPCGEHQSDERLPRPQAARISLTGMVLLLVMGGFIGWWLNPNRQFASIEEPSCVALVKSGQPCPQVEGE